MNKGFKIILKVLPFAAVIYFNSAAASTGFIPEQLRIPAVIALIIALLPFIAGIFSKIPSMMSLTVALLFSVNLLAVWVLPSAAKWIAEHFMAVFYASFVLMALLPPLFKKSPFTYEFSKRDYPEFLWETESFIIINRLISYVWAVIFMICAGISILPLPHELKIPQLLTPFLVLYLGFRLNRILPGYFRENLNLPRPVFKKVEHMLKAMPMSFNKKEAGNLKAVYQFEITGEENLKAYLKIENGKCTYHEGIDPEASVRIFAPSKVWLDLSSGKMNREEAFIKGICRMEGNGSLLMNLNRYFSPSVKNKEVQKENKNPAPVFLGYQGMRMKINKIAVFDSGYRGSGISKSTFMAEAFCAGAKEAGAQVNYYFLKDKKINHCTGCYSCWIKTPGKCIFSDDMKELNQARREADLVVLVTPLFVFSMNSLLKAFLDRGLPNVKPYMVLNNNLVSHPPRYEEKEEQGLMVFSAAGFPDVKGNFDGLSANIRGIAAHSNKIRLLGEFYLPAAEMISNPYYQTRREKIAGVCRDAGKQAVMEGKVSQDKMETVMNPEVSLEAFMKQANLFWESLDGKAHFYEGIQKI